MPAIPNPSLLARLRRTTLTELMRGRLSSGISYTDVIQFSGLDASTRSLVADICKRTRLWNDERADVARELVAHFSDGKDASISPEKLIRNFGDPDAASKLIRRAKIRNRSLLWHVLRFLRRAAGVLVLLYIAVAIYFAFGKPKISVDYVAKINEPILKVPADQRAWPFYRQLAEDIDADNKLNDPKFYVAPNVGEKRWPAVAAWVKAHPQMLSLLDQATAKPAMGFVFGAKGSVREMKNMKLSPEDPNAPFHNAMISVLLPQMTTLRHSANILASDARLAAEEHDAERWLKRIGQMRQVANQSREPRFVINYLVEIGIESLRLNQIERTLHDHPDLLSDAQLARLAHENTAFHRNSDVMSFDVERDIFADVVQRLYTDDGHGNGHLSAQGIANLQMITNPADPQYAQHPAWDIGKFALSPAAAMVVGSRKDVMEKYDYFMDRMQRRIDQPWREQAKNPDESTEAQVVKLKSSLFESIRYVLLTIMLPSLERASITAERLLTQRDAVQIAIALELYHRKQGSYPATLDELAPALLPTVPVDPCDGLPMRYKVVDGKPVVYSIGVDLKDDGGVHPTIRPDAARKNAAINGGELAIGQNDGRFQGDWILYPQSRTHEDEEDEEGDPMAATQPTTQSTTMPTNTNQE